MAFLLALYYRTTSLLMLLAQSIMGYIRKYFALNIKLSTTIYYLPMKWVYQYFSIKRFFKELISLFV